MAEYFVFSLFCSNSLTKNTGLFYMITLPMPVDIHIFAKYSHNY